MHRRVFLATGLIVTGLLLVHPCRVLLAGHYSGLVAKILNDPATDEHDVVDISAETLTSYREGIEAFEKAWAFLPLHAEYPRGIAELSIRLATWTAAMEDLGELKIGGGFSRSEAYGRAVTCLTAAVSLEPANPDLHLALARASSLAGNREAASRELETAVKIAPRNAALRHEAAVQYLLQGSKGEALRHAEALAAMDDGYRLPDSSGKQLILERRPPAYIALLARSYLFRSLELAWRASDRDIDTLRRMVPPDDEAQQVWELFQELKGVDGPPALPGTKEKERT